MQKRADELKASDIVMFYGEPYKVRSVIVRSDRAEVAFHNVNAEQPYSYERGQMMEVIA